ncbi:MAG TPA: tetratricopeptide repeat protein [Hyphomicrobiales bacterium]|nr:tetratricopeptide repeat protein [Hyphomicrobiales bacterium]
MTRFPFQLLPPLPRRLALAAVLALAATVAAPAARAVGISAGEAQDLVKPSAPLGAYLAGRVAIENHDLDAAVVFLRAALSADPKNPQLLDGTLRTLIAAGDVDQAMRLARRVVAANPKSALGRLALAVRDLGNRRYRGARREIAAGFTSPMPDVVSVILTAWAFEGSGQTRLALAEIDRLNGNELSELFRDFHGGLIAAHAGRTREADRRLRAALARDPSNFVLVDAYARFAARHGRTDEALGLYRGLAAKSRSNPRLDASIAALEQGKRPEPLVKTVQQGVAEALFGFGQLASHGESAEFSLVYLNLALHLAPQHELALLTLADLYETLEEHDRAIAVYRRFPATSPFHEDAEIRIALNLAAEKKTDEAQRQLQALLAQHPDNSEALVALGNLQHGDKHYAEAAASFSRAIDLIKTPKPDDWSLYFARAISYYSADEWPKAQADLEAALKLKPDEPAVLNYLGYSWIDRGENLQKGLDMIRQAVALRPNDGDIIDSLGWAHFKLGDYQQAATELEHAIELHPGSWEINDHLGDAYWRIGRRLEARFQWLHALVFHPDADKLAGIRKKLDDGLPPLPHKPQQGATAQAAKPVHDSPPPADAGKAPDHAAAPTVAPKLPDPPPAPGGAAAPMPPSEKAAPAEAPPARAASPTTR